MRTVLDQTGKIALPDFVQAELGVKAGDELLLENHDGQWVIMAAGSAAGLSWRGNVLVHEGVSSRPIDQILAEVRDERSEAVNSFFASEMRG